MPYTEASICNLALARIGVKDFIDSLDEATTAAQVCKVIYPHTRDVVLSSSSWSFAQRRSTLGVVANEERQGWLYGYSMPSDALAPVSIYAGSRTPTSSGKIPFSYELNEGGTGGTIWTDSEDAELIYTAKVTDTFLFSPLFVNALAWAIAAELAVAMSLRADLRDQATRMYEITVGRAMSAEMAAGHESQPDSEIITVRG